VEEKQAFALVAILVINFLFHPLWIAKKLYLLSAVKEVKI
jgi:hypothetical protein